MNFQEPLSGLFERIARAVERLGPQEAEAADFAASDAFVWHPETGCFVPVADVNRVPLSLLKGIDRMCDTLLANTERFARGACQQCTAVGRTRHGQELSRQGGAWRGKGPQPRRDSSRGHRVASASPCALACRKRASLHPILRRPLFRSCGHVLQIAEGSA